MIRTPAIHCDRCQIEDPHGNQWVVIHVHQRSSSGVELCPFDKHLCPKCAIEALPAFLIPEWLLPAFYARYYPHKPAPDRPPQLDPQDPMLQLQNLTCTA